MNKKFSILIISFLVLAFLVAIGSWFFHINEGWTFIDSIYYCVMTITTVGHGELYLTNDLSKIVASIYSLISIPIVLFVFGILAESYFESKLQGLEGRLRSIMIKEGKIEEEIEKVEVQEGLKAESNAN